MDPAQDGIRVRLLSESDLPRLVQMDQRITGRNRSAWYEGKIRRALAEADIRVSLGAERDGILVGAILGALHYGEFGQTEPVAILDTILVDRQWRSQGVAWALLDQLVRNLGAIGVSRLRTEVSWDEWELLEYLGRRGFSPVPRLVLELAVERGLAPPRAIPEP